jgi:hypothetical protein
VVSNNIDISRNYRLTDMSELHRHAHWVRNIMHNPRVSFTVGLETFKGTARIVDQDKESNSADEVSKLMDTKYGWDDGLIVELIPQ